MALSPRLRLALGLFIILIQSRGAAQREAADYTQEEKVGGTDKPEDSSCEDDYGNPCTDLKVQCGKHAQCRHTCGNYSCVCLKGFEPDPEKEDTCKDIDECQKNTSICGPYGSCINTKGDYLCKCKPGFAKSIQDDKKLCRGTAQRECNISFLPGQRNARAMALLRLSTFDAKENRPRHGQCLD